MTAEGEGRARGPTRVRRPPGGGTARDRGHLVRGRGPPAPRRGERRSYASGTPWEPVVGYARAVRVGDEVFVSGTTATDADGHLVGVGDPYVQARQALANVLRALRALGAEPEDVVRTRMYVTDIARWQEVGRAHGEVFREVRPATSMVEVRALITPEVLVEIEAEARVAPRGPGHPARRRRR